MNPFPVTDTFAISSLIDSLPAIVYVCEPEPPYRMIYISQAIESLGYGADMWLSRPGMRMQAIHEDDRGRVISEAEQARASGMDAESEYRVIGSGTVIEYGGRKAVMTITRDVTEIKRLQQQLIQSEKLAALGQLVSGMAHELNNPLTSVLGHTQLLLERASLDAHATEQLELVGAEADRARRGRDSGQRAWRTAGDRRKTLRPVLHHEARREGHGPGPVDQLRDHKRARRRDQGRERNGPRRAVHHQAAGQAAL